MTRDPKLTVPEFGEHCVTCEKEWCLPAHKATCIHKAICESCWPNGCDDCEMSVAVRVWEVPC